MSKAKTKTPGRNVKESERHGLRVQFRLPESDASKLQRLARAEGISANVYAARIVREELQQK